MSVRKVHIRFAGATHTLCGRKPQFGWMRMLSWRDLQQLAVQDRCTGCASRAEKRSLP